MLWAVPLFETVPDVPGDDVIPASLKRPGGTRDFIVDIPIIIN
jgi:hypothetical protein